jgi:ribose transport system substrate-binding protein
MTIRTLVLCHLVALAGCGGSTRAPAAGPAARKTYVIAVVPKATTHEFWKSVHAGATKAAKELGVEIIWKGPISESDREGQINLVQDFITKRVDGICLAPLDSRALVASVREAREERIPVVLFDSGLENLKDAVSFVATDNVHGGALAARRLGELLGGKGNVIVLRYTPGSQSTEERERGFLETLAAEFPGIQIISSNEYAGASAETALDKSQQLLGKYGSRVDGVFAPCQHVSAGMLRALEERDLAGKVKFVAFDSSPELARALRDQKIQGIVLQDPVRMAELAVRTMVEHLSGKPIERRIATGEVVATPSNMDTAEIKRLLEPEQYGE